MGGNSRGIKMRFIINARKGWKGKKGQMFYSEGSIKINVLGTTHFGESSNKKLFYEMLKLMVKYYDLEYVDIPTIHTGKAGTRKTKRVIIDEVELMIEKLLDDPSLRELKKRIMENSEEHRKRQKLSKTQHYYIKGNHCADCSKLISNSAFRCKNCAGKNTFKVRRMTKKCSVCKRITISKVSINKRVCPNCGARALSRKDLNISSTSLDTEVSQK